MDKLNELELITWRFLREKGARLALEAQQAVAKAQQASVELQSHALRLQGAYKLSPQDSVHEETGVITRAPAPVSEA